MILTPSPSFLRRLPLLASVLVLAWAGPLAGEEPALPAAKEYILSRGVISGKVQGDLARFTITLAVEVFSREKMVKIPLLGEDLALQRTEVTDGDEDGIFVVREAGGVGLLARKKGRYELELEAVRPLRRDQGKNGLDLFFFPAVESRIELELPGEQVAVETDPPQNHEILSDGKSTRVVLYGGAVPRFTLSWKEEVGRSRLAPLAHAELQHDFTLRRGYLALASSLELSVLQGSWEQVKITAPAALALVRVEGAQVGSYEPEKSGDGQAIVVAFREPVTRKASLRTFWELPISEYARLRDLPRLAVAGVEREMGIVILRAEEGLKLEVESADGIYQTDLAAAGGKEGEGMVFRYHLPGHALRVRAGEITARVRSERVSQVHFVGEFLQFSDAFDLAIREAGVYRLRFRLPDPNLNILEVKGENLGGWSVEKTPAPALLLEFRSAVAQRYQVAIKGELSLGASWEGAVPRLELEGAEEERGTVFLSSAGDARCEVLGFSGVTQINPQEVKAAGRPAEYPAPEQAFRFLRLPYEIRTRVTPVAPELRARLLTWFELGEHQLWFRSRVQYRLVRGGIFSLELVFPPPLRVLKVEAEDLDDWKWDPATGGLVVNFKHQREGNLLLAVAGEARCPTAAGEMALPGIAARGVVEETGMVGLSSPSMFRLKTDAAKLKNLYEIDVKEFPAAELGTSSPNTGEDRVRSATGEDLSLAYRYLEPGWELGILVEPVAARVSAEVFNFVALTRSLASYSATVRYQILYSGADRFVVRLPRGMTNVNVEGEEIKRKDKAETEEGEVWTVQLQSKRLGSYSLYLSFQQELGKERVGKFACRGVEALEVQRETGYLAVNADKDLELKNPVAANVVPLDAKEVPAGYQAGIDVPILLAYQYFSHPWNVGWEIHRHDPFGVLVAVVETCRLSTTVTEEGETVTDFYGRLRNTREQYLRMKLPENPAKQDVDIWHLFVNGIQCAPQKQLETKESPYNVLIPIPQSAEGAPIEVMLRYAEAGASLGWTGRLSLVCPPLHLPILRVGWEVHLPEGYDVVREKGSLNPVGGFYYDEFSFASALSQLESQGRQSAAPPADVQNVPAQMEQQFLMNQQAIQRGKELSPSAPARGSVYTGQKPGTRNVHCYQLLLPGEQELTIRSRYLRRSWHLVLLGLWGLILAGWFLRQARDREPVSPAQAGRWGKWAIFLLVILILGEHFYRTFVGLAFGAFLFTWLYLVLRRWREQRRERKRDADWARAGGGEAASG